MNSSAQTHTYLPCTPSLSLSFCLNYYTLYLWFWWMNLTFGLNILRFSFCDLSLECSLYTWVKSNLHKFGRYDHLIEFKIILFWSKTIRTHSFWFQMYQSASKWLWTHFPFPTIVKLNCFGHFHVDWVMITGIRISYLRLLLPSATTNKNPKCEMLRCEIYEFCGLCGNVLAIKYGIISDFISQHRYPPVGWHVCWICVHTLCVQVESDENGQRKVESTKYCKVTIICKIGRVSYVETCPKLGIGNVFIFVLRWNLLNGICWQ
jgi:hypothetical protein